MPYKHYSKHKRASRYEGYPALIKYSAFYANNEIKSRELENRSQELQDELQQRKEEVYALGIAQANLELKPSHDLVNKVLVNRKNQITNRIDTIEENLHMVNAAVEEYKTFIGKIK